MKYQAKTFWLPCGYDVAPNGFGIPSDNLVRTTFKAVLFFPVISLMITAAISSCVTASTSFEVSWLLALGAYCLFIFGTDGAECVFWVYLFPFWIVYLTWIKIYHCHLPKFIMYTGIQPMIRLGQKKSVLLHFYYVLHWKITFPKRFVIIVFNYVLI